MPLRADRLKSRRIELGLTQEELAARLNTAQNRIWRFEAGKSEPSADMLVRMAKALDVSIDYLLGLVDTPNGEISESALTSEERAVLNAYRDSDLATMLQLLVRKMNRDSEKAKAQRTASAERLSPKEGA